LIHLPLQVRFSIAMQRYCFFLNLQMFWRFFFKKLRSFAEMSVYFFN